MPPDSHIHEMPEVHALNSLVAVVVALVAIGLASLGREPKRQHLMAVVLGGAGGAYLNAGFGLWEFPFAVAVLFCAYRGLRSYPFIGIGWLLHTGWDILHHWSGMPMLSQFPTSSFECGVCDVVLAGWFFMGAPSVFGLLRRSALSKDPPNKALHPTGGASSVSETSSALGAPPAGELDR